MPDKIQPSFSPHRRWKIGFDVFVRSVLVLAVAVMANYIGAQFFGRFYLSSQTRLELSPRTLNVLHSLTNNVAVTLYYDTNPDDTDGQFYPAVLALLDEYRTANPRISVRTVDYVRDAGEAEKVKEKYGLNSATDKNVIIFDAGSGHLPQIRPGEALIQYAPTGMTKDKKIEFSAVAFHGEEMFTSMLLALEDAKPFKAYFLQGRGEPSPADSGPSGCLKFASVLREYYVDVEPLSLLGDVDVPDDCNLLIIAGPTESLSELELQKISKYLAQGGRLFALFNYASIKQPTGLESILQSWGVNVGMDTVRDMKNTTTASGTDVVVNKFGQHPIVNSLMQSELQMILPRPVEAVNWKNPPSDGPQVTELASSSDNSTLVDDSAEPPRSYPLMAAVEQKAGGGVANPRGNTRMIVTGDSIFLENQMIEGGANRDFLGYAVNWLLDRPQLVEGIGPQRVTEYQLLMTSSQQDEVHWVLLGALPGAVLLLGGLVWLARRK
jgi:hypothetical protein